MPTIPAEPGNQGFTLAEMIEEVSDQIRDIKVNTKITRWLNLEIFRLSNLRTWPFFFSTGTFNTVAAQRTYNLTNLMKTALVFSIPSIPRTLFPVDSKFMSELTADYRTVQGEPVAYILHDRVIDLFRVPDGVYTINYDYYSYPIKLTNPGDISNFPVEWHPVIIQSAVVRGFRYSGNVDQLAEAKLEYEALFSQAMGAVSRRPDQRHVLQSVESRTGQQLVPFPAHYPRVR